MSKSFLETWVSPNFSDLSRVRGYGLWFWIVLKRALRERKIKKK
jgi:hypothetical protein